MSTASSIDVANIPSELKAEPRWVCWQLEQDEDGEPTKRPYRANDHEFKAKPNDHATWSSFEDALASYSANGFDGIGFMLGDGWAGVDLDDCIDPITGVIAPEAERIVALLNSYTEISPSGHGMKIFIRGKKPGLRCVTEGRGYKQIEMYDNGRYFAVTGNRMEDVPATVEAPKDAFEALYHDYFPTTIQAEKSNGISIFAGSDFDLMGIALKEKGGKFNRLWRGDLSGHNDDHSRADLALCCKLAFYCGADPARIDNLFRQSGLNREKWEREDYRDRTITMALTMTKEFYKPKSNGHVKSNGQKTEAVVHETPSDFVDVSLSQTSSGPRCNLDNACKVLESHPKLAGHIWFDEFHEKVFTDLKSGHPVEWSDNDDATICRFMQSSMELSKMTIQTVAAAVQLVAQKDVRNEVTSWIKSLAWDGVPRLDFLMSEGFGATAAGSDYLASVGRCWMTSLVARAISPGCKVDTMPVFEGDQGAMKGTALSAIGGKWFTECHEALTAKDFYMVLSGNLLIEICELHSFNRSEVEKIKGIISCASDRYRAPYERRAASHTRKCVFAGTTNRTDWNRDDTGARRFWPVACGFIDIEWIKTNRNQLFAEAHHLYSHGGKWWDFPVDQATNEQHARRESNPWEVCVADFLTGHIEVTLTQVMDGVMIARADYDRFKKTVAAAMRAVGWQDYRRWVGDSYLRFWAKKRHTHPDRLNQ